MAPVLTIFMPALNEELSIGRTVRAALVAGDDLVEAGTVAGFEVLVVDDGSTDDTPAVLAGLAEERPEVVTVRHPVNRGVGAAMRTGFGAASGDLVLYTDADLPADLTVVGDLVRALERDRAGVVAAYRRTRAGEGLRRTVYSTVYNLMVRAVLRLRVRDVNFALKLVRRDVLEVVELRSDGILIDAELLARADRAGFRIVQVGVDYLPRLAGVSTMASWPRLLELAREARAIAPDILATPRQARR